MSIYVRVLYDEGVYMAQGERVFGCLYGSPHHVLFAVNEDLVLHILVAIKHATKSSNLQP
jgi:hypothetical protein